MGLFSSIKKSIKNSFRGGSLFGIIDKNITKPVTNEIADMFGMGALKDMAASQQAQINQQMEANKLNAMNEMQNVTQFDDSGLNAPVGDNRRRQKRSSGAFSSGISLNY